MPGEDQDLAICARPDSIVTGSNIFAIAGAASGDFEGRCPLEATLEGGTTSRCVITCQLCYSALQEHSCIRVADVYV